MLKMNLKQIFKPKKTIVFLSIILVFLVYFIDAVNTNILYFPQDIFITTLCPPNPCRYCQACGPWTFNNIINAINYRSILLFIVIYTILSIIFSLNKEFRKSR
jgi:hypothetical protein